MSSSTRGRGGGALAPRDVASDGGPGLGHGPRAHDQPEVASAHLDGVDLRVGRRPGDGLHRCGARHFVGEPDEGKDGAGDVGERDGAAVDHEPAGEHAVVHDELVDEVAEGGPGPGDEAVTTEKPTARFATDERAPVVELPHELDALLDLLLRGDDLEAGAGELSRQAFDAAEHVHQRWLDGAHEGAHRGRVHGRNVAMDVDRGSEGDDRPDALRATVGAGLVGEHAALRISAQVEVAAAGELEHAVDRSIHGAHVIVEGALHSALGVLGGTEVDDEGSDPRFRQRRHRRRVRGHVVDLARHHQRRHQQHRRRVLEARADVATKPMHRALVDHLEGCSVVGRETAEANELERVAHRRGDAVAKAEKTPPRRALRHGLPGTYQRRVQARESSSRVISGGAPTRIGGPQ